MANESNPDLESFRQQWKEEVTQKKTVQNHAATRQTHGAASTSARPPRRPSTIAPPVAGLALGKDGNHDGQFSSEDEEKATHERNKRRTGPLADWQDKDFVEDTPVDKEPESALEHYEKAVERETQGNLGDSLNLYRKAFRMDDRVDLKYKNKHFPPSAPKAPPPSSKSTDTNPSNASPTVPNTAHHSSEATTADAPAVVLSTPELIQSFAHLPISRLEPPLEGEPFPPCPISELPEEILLQILTSLAISDFPSFMKMALVCKRLAYLVATEESIWKRICVGPEIGFAGMVYEWKCNVDGTPLEEDISDELASLSLATPPQTPRAPHAQPPTNGTAAATTPDTAAVAIPTLLPPPLPTPTLSPQYQTYKSMFRYRPRIRYNGIYISTVNYVRPGAVVPSRTWGAAVHIVTYYRYLRFFRSGRCLSLLTTHEPSEIVPLFTAALLDRKQAPVKPGRQGRQRRDRSTVVEGKEDPLSLVYKGRWKLGNSEQVAEGGAAWDEAVLAVETEGCYEKYTYRMEFRCKGQERGRSRLLWEGFWALDKETGMWGEVGRKNEKGFVFSRVKAYGIGG